MDLSEPVDLGEKYDWVISLELGEHIPKRFEKTFINNLITHAKNGIILSWAVKGQGGVGHVNCQNNDYVKARMKELGFVDDIRAEEFLRKRAWRPWFKNTIMVFRKESLEL